MNIHKTLGLMVAGALAAATSPALGQDVGGAPLPDTAAMSLIFVVFPDEAGAQQALTDLNQSDTAAAGQLESYAVVTKGQSGDVKVQKSSKKDQGKSSSPRADQAIDGVVALLGQRPGQGGGAAGNQQISPENMGKMEEMLTPGTSAIIVVVAEPAADDVSAALADNDAHAIEAPIAPAAAPTAAPQPTQ